MSAKEHLRESFPCKRPSRQDKLLDKVKPGGLFGYVQCPTMVSENLRVQLSTFLPVPKNANVCRQDFEPLMQKSTEKKRFLSHTRRKINSSFGLTNGSINTHLALFYLELGLV